MTRFCSRAEEAGLDGGAFEVYGRYPQALVRNLEERYQLFRIGEARRPQLVHSRRGGAAVADPADVERI